MRDALGVLSLYEVSVEHASLAAIEDAGRHPTTYRITLTGQLDERWIDAFHEFHVESDGFIRLAFDPAKSTIHFSCGNNGEAEMAPVLETLDALVDLTNRLASATAYFDGNLGLC